MIDRALDSKSPPIRSVREIAEAIRVTHTAANWLEQIERRLRVLPLVEIGPAYVADRKLAQPIRFPRQPSSEISSLEAVMAR
jgi:hypothetical protein